MYILYAGVPVVHELLLYKQRKYQFSTFARMAEPNFATAVAFHSWLHAWLHVELKVYMTRVDYTHIDATVYPPHRA
jgi:hypothetical protein